MAANTMYDTLISLLAFKGITKTHLSDFIAKTPLNFSVHEPGSQILEAGNVCDTVVSLVSGKVRVSHPLMQGRLTVDFTVRAPSMLRISRLFGMYTEWGISVRAIDRCGTMSFDKKAYLDLLQKNQICLLNLLNHYALGGQRVEEYLQAVSSFDGSRRLAAMVITATDGSAEDIAVTSAGAPILSLVGADETDRAVVEEMRRAGILKNVSDHRIEIASRSALFEYV